ncbi:MAG: glycogen/starch synthase [Balneolaceae bacterium]|nr:glycogen/starch synthase [Balneolaceae bacterium]MBO6545719.1 glycogen/starch synthase [Balneolaceae bacterium]MBO6647115.1 glycogen/starch synthase [Balneolaceae bacterium]
MKILYAAAEISPFARMTYTADLLRFLPASLQDKGFEIRILLPKYGTINDRRNRLHEVIRLSGIEVEVGDTKESMKIKVASIPNAKLQVYFLDNDTYFKRKGLFKDPKNDEFYPDNDERLAFYNKGVLETVMKLGWEPDIIHCHDWPAGLIPLLVKTKYKDEKIFQNTQVVYNLHHPENEGTADTAKILELLGLPEDVDINKLTDNGKVDLLKLGLMFSDHVVTGNYLKDEFDEVFKELNITPKQIQGSPEDVSSKFSDYYKVIAE